MARRVCEDAGVVGIGLVIELGCPECEDRFLRGLDVIDAQVQMELHRRRRIRPGRWFVSGSELEGEVKLGVLIGTH